MDNNRPLIRVLLVAAEPVHRRLAWSILTLTGEMEVLTAEDGEEGLKLALSAHPDVVVTDTVLPTMSGIELLRRHRSEGGRAKTLAMAHSARRYVSDAAYAAGADLVLLEPTQWSEVIRAIRFLAGGLSQACRALLDRMGAPEDWAGTAQAALCAGAMAEGRCALLKSAYAEAAAQFSTGADCVEINIRRVVREVHRLQSPAYRSLPLPAEKKPPSNKEFLSALAQAAKIPL